MYYSERHKQRYHKLNKTYSKYAIELLKVTGLIALGSIFMIVALAVFGY